MRAAITIALCLGAFPAFAQDSDDDSARWETYSHDGGRGAAVCPKDDYENDDYACFLISCAPLGGPLHLRTAFAGVAFDDDSPELRITVDDNPTITIRMRRLPDADQFDFSTPVRQSRDADLLESLMAGSEAKLVLGGGANAFSFVAPLSGSRDAISALPELCGPQDDGGRPPKDALIAGEVEEILFERRLAFGGSAFSADLLFTRDGGVSGDIVRDGEITEITGDWDLEPSGRLCLLADWGGCLRFFRQGDEIAVHRDERLGDVTFLEEGEDLPDQTPEFLTPSPETEEGDDAD